MVNGVEYRYVVGSSFVKITGPASSRAVPVDEVKGLDDGLVARGRWKKTRDGMVRPSDIAAYIERSS